MTRTALRVALLAALLSAPVEAVRAWGDEGHEIIALIADRYLQPAVRQRLAEVLAGDRSGLVRGTDIAREATWADKYRDSDRRSTQTRYHATRTWHFVDLELDDSNIDAACFAHPELPPAVPASRGPAQDCLLDKIEAFRTELANPATAPEERLLAAQFLLHLVGDLHQPLHASDAHDEGGNGRLVSAPGMRSTNLHHLWDTELVSRVGAEPGQVAAELSTKVTPAELAAWRRGTVRDWAMQSFRLARDQAYGPMPAPNARGTYRLSDGYIRSATATVALQLSRAGVRLALLLNQALQ